MSRRRHIVVYDSDEDWVEASLPSDPPATIDQPSGSRSRTFQHALADAEDEYRRAEASNFARFSQPDTKPPDVKPDYDSDDEPLREIRRDDGDYAGIGRIPSPDPVSDPEEDEPDDRQCRICFGGTEEEPTLGRLISPCLCAGSMRYVHVKCINAWRGTGSNAKAFMECPQCHHRYQLRRTLVSGLATSRPLLILLSSIAFILLSLLIGQMMYWFLVRPTPKAKSKRRASTPWYKNLPGASMFEGWDIWGDDDDDDYYGGGGGGGANVVIIGGGGALVTDMVWSAVETFAVVASKLAESSTSLSQSLPSPVVWFIISHGIRFLLGVAVLGSLSFLSLLLSLSLFAPLQLANGIRGTGLLGWLRRRTGRGGGDSGAAGQIVIVLFVVIGAVNTVIQVYRVVERLTLRLLMYVETQILEVNPEDRRRARRSREEEWFKRWWREQRWATREGWREVGYRARVAAQHGLGPLWERVWHRDHEQEMVVQHEALGVIAR